MEQPDVHMALCHSLAFCPGKGYASSLNSTTSSVKPGLSHHVPHRVTVRPKRNSKKETCYHGAYCRAICREWLTILTMFV